jgi:hypothetical protein
MHFEPNEEPSAIYSLANPQFVAFWFWSKIGRVITYIASKLSHMYHRKQLDALSFGMKTQNCREKGRGFEFCSCLPAET